MTIARRENVAPHTTQSAAPQMADKVDDVDCLIRRLEASNLAATDSRIAVAQFFLAAPTGHYRAEDVQREVGLRSRRLHLSSVYRALSEMCSVGVLSSFALDPACAVYELNRGIPHDHMVCTQCKAVFDFADAMLADRRRAIAHQYGFDMQRHSLVMRGVCERCEA